MPAYQQMNWYLAMSDDDRIAYDTKKGYKPKNISQNTLTRDDFEKFLPLAFVELIPKNYPFTNSQEVFKGILIDGIRSDRQRMKRLISKYYNRPVIGDVIKNRLRSVEFQDQPMNNLGEKVGGWANRDKTKIGLQSNVNMDWTEWMFGHELGHLLGFNGDSKGEAGADAFANKYIYHRPKYCYSPEKLKEKDIVYFGRG